MCVALAIKAGELTMEKLAKRINNSTTVTQSDCYAVLKSMKDHIIEALTEGQVVVLQDLGLCMVVAGTFDSVGVLDLLDRVIDSHNS
ncbi:MAG: HU family DNA-binding protein [Bacteroidaceae bacterium]|nr:HU family DNA-binding protein [Bacteroidaceae bacterium]